MNPVYISPEHYLLDENDSASGIRHEYVNGDVYAMAGASREHNRVASRLSLRLGVHLAGSRCEVFQSEYVNGQVYAMAGASRGHNQVSMNFAGLLFIHLRGGPCQVSQSDMKVGIKRKDDVRFYYPDIQVSCEHEAESYYNTAPCLIIEVLSSSTARKDRIEKLLAYQGIASLQEYVLCSQDTPLIEIYRRRTAWQRERFTDGQSCLLESVGLEISVNDVYDFLLGDELPLSQ